ncbi:MAG TPA: DUF6496 domain-containing protein [Patescibacteria group bacterium]|nr:DUF6496 domain-containing protein [Patescibacteria group bacterium]
MNKYGPKPTKIIEKTMHQYKQGTLRSSNSNKKVTGPQQALAIGISKARSKKYKVPKEK